MKTFPIRLDDDLHKALKHAAVDKGVSLQKLIINILKYRVEKDSLLNRSKVKHSTTRKKNSAQTK